MKKIFAYILDIPILILLFLLLNLLYALFVLIVFKGFHTNLQEVLSENATGRDLLEIGGIFLKVFVIYAYFVLMPRKIGNTFAGKILKIKDNLGWRGPGEYIKEFLTTWVCPTCGRRYKDSEVKICNYCNPK